MKKLTAQAQDAWMELDENLDLWTQGKLSASDRRILMTQWVGQAADKLQSSDYDHFRWRCFEKTGERIFINSKNSNFKHCFFLSVSFNC